MHRVLTTSSLHALRANARTCSLRAAGADGIAPCATARSPARGMARPGSSPLTARRHAVVLGLQLLGSWLAQCAAMNGKAQLPADAVQKLAAGYKKVPALECSQWQAWNEGTILFLGAPLYPSGIPRPLFFDPGSNRTYSYMMSNEGANRALLTKLFHQCTHPHRPGRELVVDVGANIGFYGLSAASSGCRVIMLEPQPACTALVQKNLCLNPHVSLPDVNSVVVLPYAATAVSGQELDVLAYPHCAQVFSIYNDAHSNEHNATLTNAAMPRSRMSVPTLALDDLLLGPVEGQAGPPSKPPLDTLVHVVKVDVEGAEASVLQGMQRLFKAKRVRHLLVEISPAFYARDGLDRSVVYAQFVQLIEAGCMFKVHASGEWTPMGPSQIEAFLLRDQFYQLDMWVDCSNVVAAAA